MPGRGPVEKSMDEVESNADLGPAVRPDTKAKNVEVKSLQDKVVKGLCKGSR